MSVRFLLPYDLIQPEQERPSGNSPRDDAGAYGVRMQPRRSLVAALVLAAVGVATLSASSAVAGVSDQVPVTQDENITLWAGTMQAPMNLLANDSDPEGERLQICRFGDPQPDWQLFVEPVDFRRGGRVQVTLEPTATGVYTFEYRVCDHSYLVPATLTVNVQPVAMTTIEKVPDRPRHLRVTNPDEHSVYFVWFRHNTDELLGYVEVASGDSQLIRAGARRIDWASEFIDGDYEVLTGYGTVGGLTASRIPQSARTLATVSSTLIDVLERERRDDRRADGTTDGVADPTTVVPPITQGDEVTWWSGSMGRVHVLSNDSDPQGQGLDVCRVDRSGRAVSGWTQLDNTGFTVESNHEASGTYAITYYACNDARLTPGTVTVHLRRAKPVQVSDHGGTLRIANPNGERVRVGLTRLRDYGPLRQLTISVPAHGVRHVPLTWHRVRWYATIGHHGGYAGYGTLNR